MAGTGPTLRHTACVTIAALTTVHHTSQASCWHTCFVFRGIPASDIGPGIVYALLTFMAVILSSSRKISGQHLKVGYHNFRQHYICTVYIFFGARGGAVG